MKYLFVHQNFPAQFKNFAAYVASNDRNEVVAIGCNSAKPLRNVELIQYALPPTGVTNTHAFARSFDTECRRAEQLVYACVALQNRGFTPDVILVHCGWGEGLPLRTVFPSATIVVYAEMFYRGSGIDVGFDREFQPMSLDQLVGLHLRNASTLLSLSECDAAISPTQWQRSTYPDDIQRKITVIHDGVDVDRIRPDPAASVMLDDGTILRAGDPVVTFVSRDLEPLRGYHSFVRALPQVLRQHPRAQVLILGGEGVSYGHNPPPGSTWKTHFLNEVADQVDHARLHFVGRLDYDAYIKVLQVSAVHVYLTYPFVLSWSLLEAMATGCVVVGSATPPVQEIIDGRNGLLVDFFDSDAIASCVLNVLATDRSVHDGMRVEARQTIVQRYDSRVCVLRIQDLIERIRHVKLHWPAS